MAPTAEHLLGTIVEQNRNLEKNLDKHTLEDSERFERTFSYIKDEFGKMGEQLTDFKKTLDDRLTPTETKVNTMWDDKNKQEGVLSFGRLAGGSVCAVIGVIITLAAQYYTGKADAHASNSQYQNEKMENSNEKSEGRNI